MKIGILPLDSRPCNFRFGEQLGRIFGDVEVDVLPKEYAGCFMEPADASKVKEFLYEGANKWDYLIVAIDMLCYGGLIQGRQYREDYNLEYCLERLRILELLKERNPKLKIFAFNVILRLSITASSSEYVKYWKDISLYSEYAYLAKREPEKYSKMLEEVKGRIPKTLLDSYLKARQRNHVVNLTCIEYVNKRIIDYLDLCQEDSNVYGLQLIEQERLQQKIREYNLNQHITIKNGTDEEISLLVGRAINEISNTTPKIYLHYLNKNNDFVAKYEDRPLVENIKKSIESAKCKIAKEIEDSDFLLIISPFPEKQIDLVFEEENNKWIQFNLEMDLEKFKDYPYAFLDITYANGGSPYLLEKILSLLGSENLVAYSAWNTASNSIGTLIGQLSALKIKTSNLTRNKEFLLERIFDDCFYQGLIRRELNNELQEQGVDFWNFSLPKEKVKEIIEPRLNEKVTSFLKKYDPELQIQIDYTFPWNRTFEIDLTVHVKNM